MRINKKLIYLIAGAALLAPSMLKAQSSSINTFSPYTLYGLGDIYNQGPTEVRSMGGAGAAYFSPLVINTLNPASYATFGQKSFLFNFGLEGGGHYLKAKGSDGVTRNSSYNVFNVSNLAIGFPIAKGLGASLSLSPFTNVGYRIERKETDEQTIGTIGDVRYTHIGEGGINQMKFGLGLKVSKTVSIGAEGIYYKGRISRMYNEEITPTLSGATYYDTSSTNFYEVSRFFGMFGAQWNVIASPRKFLTLGATYHIGGELKANNYRYIPSNNVVRDTVDYTTFDSNIKMPHAVRVGVNYATPKVSLSADYSFKSWGSNKQSGYDHVQYQNTNGVHLGVQYIPNRYDVRRVLNRWSYRAGLRYEDYYLKINGKSINDKAVTMGVGIPIRMSGLTSVNVGLEAGQRGRVAAGMIRENYFKITIGLSLFGEDFWFVQPKYD